MLEEVKKTGKSSQSVGTGKLKWVENKELQLQM